MHKHKKTSAAFTLIEVLLVLAILVLLAGVAVVVYTNVMPKANIKAATAMVDNTESAVEQFQIDLGRFPTQEEGLTVLVEAPEDEDEAEKWGGPYLDEVPTDPWGEELQYEYIEATDGGVASFRVYSLGPDKEEGTDDDIPQKEEEGGLD